MKKAVSTSLLRLPSKSEPAGHSAGKMVRGTGFEPVTPAVSEQCSTTELTAHLRRPSGEPSEVGTQACRARAFCAEFPPASRPTLATEPGSAEVVTGDGVKLPGEKWKAKNSPAPFFRPPLFAISIQPRWSGSVRPDQTHDQTGCRAVRASLPVRVEIMDDRLQAAAHGRGSRSIASRLADMRQDVGDGIGRTGDAVRHIEVQH